MKRFLFLLAFSLTAQAACEVKNCQTNFTCAQEVWRASADEAEMEKYTEYSKKNQCNDELKFAALFAEDENAQTMTAKTDLPVIPDAPVRAPANNKE
jgi:hypothetical protein